MLSEPFGLGSGLVGGDPTSSSPSPLPSLAAGDPTAEGRQAPFRAEAQRLSAQGQAVGFSRR